MRSDIAYMNCYPKRPKHQIIESEIEKEKKIIFEKNYQNVA